MHREHSYQTTLMRSLTEQIVPEEAETHPILKMWHNKDLGKARFGVTSKTESLILDPTDGITIHVLKG